MEKHCNNAILVSEICVVDCLKMDMGNHKMNNCIQRCLIHERICKALKVCIQNKCDKDTLICLMSACLNSGLSVVEECSKHNMKCCQKCVQVIGKMNNVLKQKCKSHNCVYRTSKSKKSTKKSTKKN